MSSGAEEHAVPLRVYVFVWLGLLVLTGATVACAQVDLGALGTPIALAIAGLKGALVVLYFMHVRWSGALVWVFAGAGLVWLVILIGFTLSDYLTRDWVPVYG
jgi:cytochrome c oxidase subunit 4